MLVRYQDAETGTWSLVVNQAARKGSYAEASGSSMMVYALAKGGRLGYLDKKKHRSGPQRIRGPAQKLCGQ